MGSFRTQNKLLLTQSFEMVTNINNPVEQYAQMSQEEIDSENRRVWKVRSNMLIGKTIIGTLTSTTNSKGRTFHYIKWWNKAKCDTVKVPVSFRGHRQPRSRNDAE